MERVEASKVFSQDRVRCSVLCEQLVEISAGGEEEDPSSSRRALRVVPSTGIGARAGPPSWGLLEEKEGEGEEEEEEVPLRLQALCT